MPYMSESQAHDMIGCILAAGCVQCIYVHARCIQHALKAVVAVLKRDAWAMGTLAMRHIVHVVISNGKLKG